MHHTKPNGSPRRELRAPGNKGKIQSEKNIILKENIDEVMQIDGVGGNARLVVTPA